MDSERVVPRLFDLPSVEDAVTVLVAEIPTGMAEILHQAALEVLQALGPSEEPSPTTYVSEKDIMHMTLFYTSHPDDLSTQPKLKRIPQEIALLRKLATQFEPFDVIPVKVTLAASGAVLLLFECESDGKCQDSTSMVNAGCAAEFSVDLIRHRARQTFPFVSNKGPSAIIHTTLARVLTPDVTPEALSKARAKCAELSRRFAAHKQSCRISRLWYVDESHFIAPRGQTTVIELGGSQ